MNSKYLKIFFLSVILIFSSGFNFDSISKYMHKAGYTFSKFSGVDGIIEGAFEPAINRYEDANRRSIYLLNEKLSQNISQLNEVILERENQLDEILKISIFNLDENIRKDIELLDESLRSRIGQFNIGLISTSYSFTASLWLVFRGTSILILILIVIALVIRFISQYYSEPVVDPAKKKRLIKSLLFQLSVAFVGLLLIGIFQPTFFKKFVDPSYTDKIEDYKQNLSRALEISNYNESYFYAISLSQFEGSNAKYKYYASKSSILKKLMYRPKVILFSTNELEVLIDEMKDLDYYDSLARVEDKDFKDFDGDIIKAIFWKNSLKNKEGNFLAAFYSSKYISSGFKLNSKLRIIALDLINTYSFHRLTDEQEKGILTTYEIVGSVPNFSEFSKENCNEIEDGNICLNLKYNKLIRDLYEKDEVDFFYFMKEKNIQNRIQIAKGMLTRWTSKIDSINSMGNISSYIKMGRLGLNAGFVHAIISFLNHEYPNYQNEFLLPVTAVTDALADKLINTTQLKEKFGKLNEIEKHLSIIYLNNFQFESKLPILITYINYSLGEADSIALLEQKYDAYKTISDGEPLDIKFRKYVEYIDLLLKFDLYSDGKPLAQIMLNEFNSKYSNQLDDNLKNQLEIYETKLNKKLINISFNFIN